MKTPLAALLILLCALTQARAITVSSVADSGPGSLRQALVDAVDGDLIQFDAALNGQVIGLVTGELVINKNITISGPGPALLGVARVGAARFRVFSVTSGHTVAIEGLAIRNGYADASIGGGIMNEGELTINECFVTENLSDAGGGGGGIYSSGVLRVHNTTISGNRAGFNTGFPLGYGGGILCGGELEITNSTVSGNVADIRGGALHVSGTITIRNSTIGANHANVGGNGIYNFGDLEITNTILDGSATIQNNSDGTVTSGGYNIANDTGGGFLNAEGDQVSTEPRLGPLQDNGGPTFTHGLLVGSPAINGGNPVAIPPMPQDQRGYPRIFGGRLDVGSVEDQPPPSPSPTPTPTGSPTATPMATPTPTATVTPTPIPSATPSTSTVLGNISTRLRTETGDDALIGGFIITGTQPKRVIVRAIGPSLSLAGTLANPSLELHDSSGGLIASNDNWRSNQEAEIMATGIPPSNDLEAAILATLPASGSAYTAIVRGMNNGTGIGVVEAYDLDQTVDSKLANISTRGLVQTGNNVLIAGTIVLGPATQRVLVRAIGPSLPVDGKLENPTLELRDGNGGVIRTNDNWRSDQESEIVATTIPPNNDLESALIATLPANGAAYTAIVSGVGGTMGVAVVEIYGLN